MSDDQRKTLVRLLGPLEIEIMNILWGQGQATVQDVLEQLQKNKDYAYTTIMTVMSRLTKKGVLKREKKGKVFVYQPAYSPDEWIEKTSSHTIQSLLEDFGDVAIAQFVDVVGHKPEHLKKLKRFIQQLEQGDPS
ncbi:BlaI/MecI/CopY family transcriptional regulator [Paenactinomyces guangxiensis]|uniref:BlaI/MecI/CopY family transcriptional regulator n=1 Tax=Paenactinomyces guangxiensis TaxID=1490290 RepID=A0A7W1WSR5_9BACL|nr:BlaI/MecI/CopY family transcriptional regulator [Paenactinomyces guangxiensis]MBH8592580.1 BlaI/MecI/CopY family transcriptional regulator [Paenactinomyces guangxiensis]